MTATTGSPPLSPPDHDGRGGGRMRPGSAWRIIGTEAKRGSTLAMLIAVAGAGTVVLFTHPEHWAGRWYALAADWRAAVGVMAPIATAIGAWQGSRDQRRRTLELIGSTSKSPLGRMAVAWLVPAGVAGLGALLVWGAGAVLVGPVATYDGTDWVWTIVGGVVGVIAFAALGAALGSLSRSVPVIAVIGLAALLVPPVLGHVRWRWGPASDWFDRAEFVTLETSLAQVAWLGGLAALAVMVVVRRPVSPRQWPPIAVSALVAFSGFTGLFVLDHPTRVDAEALALTCTGSEPELCVSQDLAFWLDAVGPIVVEETARWDQFEDMPERVVDVPPTEGSWPPPPGVHEVRIGGLVDLDGGLADDARRDIAVQLSYALTQVPAEDCSTDSAGDLDSAGEHAYAAAHTVAHAWGVHIVDPTIAEQYLYGQHVAEFRQLTAMSDDDQVGWISRYRAAARSCDVDALAALGRELAP